MEKIRELLQDATKFKRLENLPEERLSFVINSQNKIKSILKVLMIKAVEISPVRYFPRILYDNNKIQKPVLNNFSSFRPIPDAIKRPSYKLAKFLVLVLSPLITNEFTVKNCFPFV